MYLSKQTSKGPCRWVKSAKGSRKQAKSGKSQKSRISSRDLYAAFRENRLTKAQEDYILRNFIRNQLLKYGNDLKIPHLWRSPVSGIQQQFSDKAKRYYHELRKELGISASNPRPKGTPVKIPIAAPRR